MAFSVVEPYPNIHIAMNDFGNPDGPVIVVNHDTIASIREEALFSVLVENGMRVIALARPGYGASPPLLFRSIAQWGHLTHLLLSDMGIRKYFILGISAGSTYALSMSKNIGAIRTFIVSGYPAFCLREIKKTWPEPYDYQKTLRDWKVYAMRNIIPADFYPGKSAALDDSVQNHCFGIASDLFLRIRSWDFDLLDIPVQVDLVHSFYDPVVPHRFMTQTSSYLLGSKLHLKDSRQHFSKQMLDDTYRDLIHDAVEYEKAYDAKYAMQMRNVKRD